jgi:hypothetical protein
MIENVGDKLVIDMYNGVTTDGTGVTVVPAGSDKGQIWTVDKPDGSGYQYSASSLIFHNALDSSQTEVLAADPNTLAVQISSFSYGTYRAEQLWTRSSVTNSSPHAWYVQTTSSGQTLCLTAHGKQGQLTVAACVSGDKAQQWIFH